MFRSAVRTSLCSMVMALLVGACSDDTSTNPVPGAREAADDLAVQAAASAAAATGGAIFELEAASAGIRTLAGKGTVTHAAADTTFTLDGLTFAFSRTFYNLQGDPLPGYAANAVRLVIGSRVSGNIITARYTATLGRAGTLEVRGLHALADTLEFDGSAQDTTQCEFHSLSGTRQRYFYAVGSRTMEDVRLLKDHTVNPWPLSGRILWTLAADRLRSNNRDDVEWHVTGTAILTFNGTATPDLVVNGTFRYRLNLLTGEVTVQ